MENPLLSLCFYYAQSGDKKIGHNFLGKSCQRRFFSQVKARRVYNEIRGGRMWPLLRQDAWIWRAWQEALLFFIILESPGESICPDNSRSRDGL